MNYSTTFHAKSGGPRFWHTAGQRHHAALLLAHPDFQTLHHPWSVHKCLTQNSNTIGNLVTTYLRFENIYFEISSLSVYLHSIWWVTLGQTTMLDLFNFHSEFWHNYLGHYIINRIIVVKHIIQCNINFARSIAFFSFIELNSVPENDRWVIQTIKN